MLIKDKVVLITGASEGVGAACAAEFAACGAKLSLAARNEEGLRRAGGADAAITAGDLTLEATRRLAIERTIERFGTIDILINNAGVAGYGNPVSMNFASAIDEMNVNYFGALLMTRALAPAMIERGEGMIVNIATAFAKINLPIVGTYCASKAALLSLGQALRAYLSEQGVHVMTVMPTTFESDMSKGADVPKMTKEFVAGEILRHIREESVDPPIGEEATGVLDGLKNDPLGLERMLSQIRA